MKTETYGKIIKKKKKNHNSKFHEIEKSRTIVHTTTRGLTTDRPVQTALMSSGFLALVTIIKVDYDSPHADRVIVK